MNLDPFTFEVLRHRLWTVNAQGALAMQRVSGSPLATEAFDMNTSIMTAAGEVVFVGPYLLTGPMGQGMIARWILERYAVNPGIAPGDMFLCNDPYVGAAHQNCVTVLAPIHVDGRLLAWAGATLHVVDVGGGTAGQVGIGATSIFDEAPVIPPLRIVRDGVLLADAEASYLRRSRTPELNALDLRAKIAALNAIAAGVRSAAAEFGAEAVAAALALQVDRAEAHLRRRVADLPDGETRHVAYLDRSDTGQRETYEVAARLEKRGDRLRLDFRDASDQAPAVVNCTRSGLLSAVLVGVLTTLVWDGPWCPAAVERVVEVRSRPGSVVDAAWPAGCSMATMAAGFAATTATTLTIGELLAREPRLRERAMASWAGAVGSVDVFGVDRTGRPFGTVLLDTMASGTGATAVHDGIDTGGFIRSLACVVANVEHVEAQFPLLYLYRRQEPDSGGAGRRRGGVGVGFAVLPHGVEAIERVSPHFSGTLGPESLGLAGGGPGAVNRAVRVVGSRVPEGFRAGELPAAPEELGGRPEILPGVAAVPLEPGDVLIVSVSGGGGVGDPIEREAELVARDVAAGLVSRMAASETYGVVVDGAGRPDEARTAARRSAIRAGRVAEGAGDAMAGDVGDAAAGGAGAADGWTLRGGPAEAPDSPFIVCNRCGFVAPAGPAGDPLAGFPLSRRPIGEDGRRPEPAAVEFELLERYCPRCGRRLEVNRAPAAPDRGDP